MDARALIPTAQVAYRGTNYVLTRCLWHHDQHPSLRVYADGAYCPACGMRSDILTLARHLKGEPVALRDLPQAALVDTPVSVERVEPPQDLGRRLHAGLTETAVAYYLYERGLTLDTVVRYQLGWGALTPGGAEGYTIPVYRQGRLKQVKLRVPGVERQKYRSVAGAGTWLYLGDDVDWQNQVILTEGEFDALVLRQAGYLACSSTGGAQRLDPRWFDEELAGTVVYCCFDGDTAGDRGYDLAWTASRGYTRRIVLPDGVKDVTALFLAGQGDVFPRLLAEAEERFACTGR